MCLFEFDTKIGLKREGRERGDVDGDHLRFGGEGIGGAGGVQHGGEHRECRGTADPGEDCRNQRRPCFLLPGSPHLPRQAH